MKISSVALLRVYPKDDLNSLVRKGLTMIHQADFCSTDKVIIKPNLNDLRSSETGTTTDPKLVEAVVRVLQERNVKDIYIAESNHAVASADECFERLGYNELAEKLGICTLNLSKERKMKIKINGFFLKEIDLPEIFLHCSKFISMPKIKTHSITTITCAMKNQFGLIPAKNKSKYHPFLTEVLADLNTLFKPDVVIVDGIVAMEGNGPSHGRPKELNLIIFGDDPIAVDVIVAKLMGLSPCSIPHLKFCVKKKLTPDKVDILGARIEDVETSFDIPWPRKAVFFQNMSFKLTRIGYAINNYFEKISHLSMSACYAPTSHILRYSLQKYLNEKALKKL